MDRKTTYTEPAVESFEDLEIFGDAPAVGTHVPQGSQIATNQA